LRAPDRYMGLLEHALRRARIPAWFDRGTRRPHPAGRAFLAVLACAVEKLSARRFAEYLSLGQVPRSGDAAREPAFVPPLDDELTPTTSEDHAPPSDEVESADDPIVAGTLRAPWKWE